MNINDENAKIYTEQTGDWHEYNPESADEIRKRAKQLKTFAMSRGWLYRYDSSPN